MRGLDATIARLDTGRLEHGRRASRIRAWSSLCSFQKEESVLLDVLMRLAPARRASSRSTPASSSPRRCRRGRAFEEHYGIARRGRRRHADASAVDRPRALLRRRARSTRSSARSTGADAWITGIRREQAADARRTPSSSSTTTSASIWKYNPLADWTERDLWQRIHERDLPYHPLHDQGYASIGCAPCTQPGDGREGRWAGTDKTECGIHVVAIGPGPS